MANRLDALLQQHPVEVFFSRGEASDDGRYFTPSELPKNVHLQTFRTSLTSDLRKLSLPNPHRILRILTESSPKFSPNRVTGCSPFPPRVCDPARLAVPGELSLLVRLQHLFSKEDDPSALSQPATVDLSAWLGSWLGDALHIEETTLTGGAISDSNAAGAPVTLQPMQIRTFLVTLKLK